MLELDAAITCLERAPRLLRELLAPIPAELLRRRRLAGKWTIHEHACHVATVERDFFFERWRRFQEEARPEFTYFGGESNPDDYYLRMDLNRTLAEFDESRARVVELARAADADFWSRPAVHPQYTHYTPAIMVRHLMLHDQFHMYRIEELWLTRDEFLSPAPAPQ